MTKKYVAVDLGATSGRVILSTIENGKISMETVCRFRTPLEEKDGKYYWDIFFIFDNICQGLKKLAGQKIESIGIDTWGVDFSCIGADGEVTMPRAYRDPYTNGAPEEFFKIMPKEELYRRTGIQIMNFNSVFQLFQQRREGRPELLNAKKILFMPDALSYMLTGKMVCEYTILSTSALMDPRTKKLDPEVLKACGMKSDQFAEIVYPGHVVGTLKDEVKKATGLGDVPVIAVAGHDTGSAVAAVPARDEHFAYLSSGTWSLMGIEAKEPVIDDKMFKLNYTNEGGVGGTTRLLKNITGMWILEQCLAKWRSEGKEYNYVELVKMASDCEPSANLLDPDAPCFAAPQDMPKAIADYCIQKGWPAPADHAHTVRLIYDSLAGKYGQVFRDLQGFSKTELNVLHIIGGGSQNAFLDQLTADACGVKVVAGPAEGTALGNIMIQAGLSRPEIADSIDTREFLPR